MDNINEIITLCETALETGEITDEDLVRIIELSKDVIGFIKDFVDQTGYDWYEYAQEFLAHDKYNRDKAINAFAEILEVMGGY